MQALILAAGMGRRLGKITEEKTKGMVEVNGKTLLERSLEILTSFDEITRIVIVIGYEGDKVKSYFGDTYNKREIVYVVNPIYDQTNNIYSLYLAEKEFRADDTILLESDLIFERRLIEKLILDKKQSDLVLVAPWEDWMEGTVVTLSQDGQITQFISREYFDYKKTSQYYKTVNIYKFSKKFVTEVYLPFLQAYCQAFGLNEYYENILGILALSKRTDLRATVLSDGEVWYEIDDLNDLDIAETLFSDNNSSYMNRYGGFWRFPKILDFCFVQNPYFPSERMIEDFKIKLPQLMSQFPSTFSIQKKLAAGIFSCSPEQIVVGNGASELINALLNVMEYDKIGVSIPTFYEYVARAKKEKVRLFRPINENYRYSAQEMIEFSRNLSTLVVVNPDNPCGNFIPKNDMLGMVDALGRENKIVIVDETFVDFVDGKETNTFIDSEILTKYDNLVVIRSLGKSFGVSGFRLGVLASGNADLIEAVSDALPIWNVSSICEYFLQILHRYRTDYMKSLQMVVEQRKRIFAALCESKYLRPIPSSANYIVCEVLEPYNCETLAQAAMKKHILVKDCSRKTGFNGGQFVRISVRSEEDNSTLIDFVRKM